jgi:PAS domain S-box-containing protein
MHKKSAFPKWSISKKMMLINLSLCLVFFLIIGIAAYSSFSVRRILTNIVENNMRQVLDNSNLSRELSVIFAKIDLLTSTFYGDDNHLEAQGREITSKLNNAIHSDITLELADLLNDLLIRFSELLENYRIINTILSNKSKINEAITSNLNELEETIGEMSIDLALQDMDTSFMDQLLILTIGYRESLLQAESMFLAIDNRHYLSDLGQNQNEIIATIDDVQLRLETLSAASFQIAKIGKALTNNTTELKKEVTNYFAATSTLMATIHKSEATRTDLLKAIALNDKAVLQVADGLRTSISDTIFNSAKMTALSSLAVALLITIATLTFISKNIRHPLKAILITIESIRQGNLSETATLNRDDEWGAIEKALNTMASDLSRTYFDLEENEKKFRLIAEQSTIGITIIQNDHTKYVNLASSEILCNPAEQISRWHIEDYEMRIHPPEDLKFTDEIRKIQNGSNPATWHNEWSFKTRQGKSKWIECLAKSIRYDGGNAVLVTFIDIESRKQAEKNIRKLNQELELRVEERAFELSKKELKLQSLLHTIQAGVVVYSTDMTIIDINTTAQNIFGIKKNQLSDTSMINPAWDLIDENGELLRRDNYPASIVKHTKKSLKDFVVGIKKPIQNETVWVLINSDPQFDENGKLTEIIISSMDISDLKNTQNQLKEKERQLVQAQKMEAIGTLAGGIAHDFNNILAAIIGFTEMAIDDVQTDSITHENLKDVLVASNRAKDLVSQILAFARQSEQIMKPTQVGRIAVEVLKLIRSSIPATIEIKQKIESNSLILGNPTQVHQILMNLCTNASHAMEKDGGILQVNIKDIIIDNTSNSIYSDLMAGDYIEIMVSDTGAGISPDMIESIFEPYFTTKGQGEGTGLGLAVIHGIVESYEGMITVESELGKGAVFKIILPITQKRNQNFNYKAEELASGMEHILFVDDEALIAKMGAMNLERLGYEVTSRTSSVEALELFRSRSDDFDLIITDMTMPNLTGDKLSVELMRIRPDIPVILCTGYSNIISKEKAEKIGIKAFIHKPIAKTELAKTVRNILDETKELMRYN